MMTLFVMTLSVYSFAQEKFELTFDLVKPSGKLDSTSYFYCTLKNLTDTLYCVHSGEVGGSASDGNFVVEVMRKDGTTYTLYPMQGFYWTGANQKVTHFYLLQPHTSVTQKHELFRNLTSADGRFYGVVESSEDIMKKIDKIRIRMVRFWADNLVVFKPYRKDEIISNWVKIDSDEFIAYFQKLEGFRQRRVEEWKRKMERRDSDKLQTNLLPTHE